MNNSMLLFADTTFEPHLHELKDLPFIIHRNTHHEAGSSGPANLHQNIEILRFTKGCGKVLCGENTYPISLGSLLIVNSYLNHQVIAQEDIEFDCLIVGSGFCAENGIDVSLLSFDTQIRDAQALSLFGQVMDSYDNQDHLQQARLRCGTLALMIHLCQKHAQPRTTAITENLGFQSVITAIGYIQENLQHKLTVEQVAKHAGFSKYYFLRLFRQVTGYTLVQYINLLRCERARDLLRTGKHTVKETALLCGFDNLSYFSNVFKKNIGCLPSVYKRHSKKKA